MTARIHANNFATTINGAILSSDTTIVLTSIVGLPSFGSGVNCYFTLQAGTAVEIVIATAISSNTITVTRAAEGTSAVGWADGTSISIRPTANSVDRKLDIAALPYTPTTGITPTITFSTPGDLSVSYVTQSGAYAVVGTLCTVTFTLIFTPTYTTASGFITIGFGVAPSINGNPTGCVALADIAWPAGSTCPVLQGYSGNTVLIKATGTTLSNTNFTTTEFTSGVVATIAGSISYLI